MIRFKDRKAAILTQKQFECAVLKKLNQIEKDVLFLKTAMDVRDECFYPPEKKLNKDFVKEAEEASKRVKAGMGKAYTPEEFEAKFS